MAHHHYLLCCAFRFCLVTVLPLPCSFMMEYDIHTLLDFLTLLATVWVIYMLRFPLRSSYQDKEDSLKFYFVVSLGSGCFAAQGEQYSPHVRSRAAAVPLLACRSVYIRLLLCFWVMSAVYMALEQQRVLRPSSNDWLAAVTQHEQA